MASRQACSTDTATHRAPCCCPRRWASYPLPSPLCTSSTARLHASVCRFFRCWSSCPHSLLVNPVPFPSLSLRVTLCLYIRPRPSLTPPRCIHDYPASLRCCCRHILSAGSFLRFRHRLSIRALTFTNASWPALNTVSPRNNSIVQNHCDVFTVTKNIIFVPRNNIDRLTFRSINTLG